MKSETDLLDDMCELIADCPHSTPKWTDSGILVIRNQNIKNGRLDLSKPSYTNEENYQFRIKRAKPKENDIVFTREAPMGELCLIPKDLKVCLGQRQVLLRPKDTVNAKYLYYALQSFYVRHQISWNEGTGTTVSNIRIPFLKQFLIPRNKNSEDQIAHILSTLDNKRELNRKMNQTLEEMAQVLFKSWFVNFDPIHAKAGCKSDEELEATAQELGISKEVLELFPSEFVESEIGMIPEGWSYDSLSNHISVTKGKSYKSSELEESTTALVTLKSFLRGGGYRTDGIKPYTGKYKEEQIVEPGELIMAYTDVTQAADVIGKPAIVLKDETIDTLVASLDVGIVRVTSQAVNLMYLYQLFKTRRFQGYILGHTSGTTVLHLAKGWFDSYRVLLPQQELMDAFDKIVTPLFTQIQLNIEQERSLQKIRDTLLPKLLSGELDVSNIEFY